MKLFFTRFINTLLFLFFLSGLSFAQTIKDYSLLLNSGKFIPDQNIETLSKSSDVFQKSLFNDKYYVTIQFNSLPDELMKKQLKVIGVELLDYIPAMAYTAAVNKNLAIADLKPFPIRSIFQFSVAQKTIPAILIKNIPAHAVKTTGYADVSILLYENLAADKIIIILNELESSIIKEVPVFRMITVRVPQEKLTQLVALPFVQWAEYIAPLNIPENLPGRSLHRTNILNDGVRNLKGDGMNIGVWDEIASQHLDFSPAGRLINVEAGSSGSHGTHVSGTIGGKGLINPFARGMAPNATIYSYNGFNDDVQIEMSTAIPDHNLISSNHSYHDGLGVQCGLSGASAGYSLTARNTDINLNNNPFHLHCHSAGNAQSSCSNGWGTITGTGKAAKNNMVVASITSFEAITNYSSFGPVHDGRVKPEISAMGDNVFSTYTPLNTYNTISGTSMSTPGVTGTVALLAQRYKQLNGNVLPPSSLIKNITCNAATDLGNAGPDYRFGFGRINALAAVRILEENRYAINSITTAAINDITVSVPGGTARIKVMLTWNDPAAASNASVALVNNLDLSIINGATTYLPWILDPRNPATPATKAIDNISNIEQVTVDNPPAGVYTVRVNGTAVPVGANQPYTLTWIVDQPYIEIIYPNGNESFNPGTTQVITWDNAGITTTQTVEYSLNNGSSWNTIGTVTANTTRFNWSIPAGANTSTAVVKVTSGIIEDFSDVNFKILGTPTGLAVAGAGCNAGEIKYNWTAVSTATQYDLYRLDATTGTIILLGADITGTSYTATGLMPGTTIWATLVAKNITTGSVSERSIAISGTVSNGGGLSPIGSISGQTLVCGITSNIIYTVPIITGASSYTWTVPPNTAIISGQGTNSITLNYTASSTNGNVTVFASSASCQTATANLTITVHPLVAAPITGGDQIITVCPPNTIPILTATATVPPGHTLIWYDAAAGGNVASSPVLSTAGIITYYAASRNTATGCESPVRSAVKLNITAALPTTITASGPVTFCQGNNVVLTANAGTSYLWSNGSTSQTIGVTASGSYIVMVTTGSCNLSSAPTIVKVNTKPQVTLSAAPFTKLFPGLTTTLTASINPSGSYTINWYKNNSLITLNSTTTTVQATINDHGTYSVTAITTDGCSNISNNVVIGDSASTKLFVYPNPTDGAFQIRYYTTTIAAHNITIYDAKGAMVYKKIYNISTPYQQMTVDIKQHGSGVYQIVLHDNTGKKLATKQVSVL